MRKHSIFLIGIAAGVVLSSLSLPYFRLNFIVQFPWDILVLDLGLALLIISVHYYAESVCKNEKSRISKGTRKR